MYCPNCKEHSDDKYCPKCGTMLIDEPQTAGLTFGVGDGTAINGSINVAHTDSHNSYDQRVINTSNVSNTITNIQERQKSEIELMQERKNLFFNACKRAYEDNILEQEELIQLESYRVELGLKKDEADRLLDKVRELVNRNATKSELTGIAKIKLKQLSEALKRNEIPALMQQIDSFEALASKFTNDELQYKYFLVLSALKPEKCIEKCEALKADNYWKSYWSCLAYRKIGNTVESDKTLMDLEAFDTFPEDNTLLLGAACALIDGKAAEATDYLTSVVGEFSPALQRFADSIYYIADPAMAQELDVKEDKCAFYLVNFFNHQIVDKAAEEETRCKAEAEAKHKAEEAAQRKIEAEVEEEARRKIETEAKCRTEEEARCKAGKSVRMCPNCKIEVDSKFCPECGTPIVEMAVLTTSADTTAPNKIEPRISIKKLIETITVTNNSRGEKTWEFDEYNDFDSLYTHLADHCNCPEELQEKEMTITEIRDYLEKRRGHDFLVSIIKYANFLQLGEDDWEEFESWFVNDYSLYGKYTVQCRVDNEEVIEKTLDLSRSIRNIKFIHCISNFRVIHEDGHELVDTREQTWEALDRLTSVLERVGADTLPLDEYLDKDDAEGVLENEDCDDILKEIVKFACALADGKEPQVGDDGLFETPDNLDEETCYKICFLDANRYTCYCPEDLEDSEEEEDDEDFIFFDDEEGDDEDSEELVAEIEDISTLNEPKIEKRAKSPELLKKTYGAAEFVNDKSIKEVIISASVESIDKEAFKNCAKLESVTFEEGSCLKKIGHSSFIGCKCLKTITIPASVECIDTYSFKNCAKLESVIFEDDTCLNKIGNSAFMGCKCLKEITIPASVGSIDNKAFNDCAQLGMVTFENNSCLKQIGSTFANTPIDAGVFAGCKSLNSITIPSSVECIGKGTFWGCEGLQEVIFEQGSCLKHIAEYAFYNCKSLTSITILASVECIGRSAFCECKGLQEVKFEQAPCLKNIGDTAFGNCKNLKNITIPSTVNCIDARTFIRCESLTSIIIPASVKSIGTSAFDECKGLEKVIIENNSNLKGIGWSAFENCDHLQSITIPATVEKLGGKAFINCINLKSVIFENNSHLTEISNNAFENCQSLKEITLPNSAKDIGKEVFKGCKSLPMMLRIKYMLK